MNGSDSPIMSNKRQINPNQVPLLQDHLFLTRFLCRLLGYDSLDDLFEVLKNQQEGWTDDGYSFFFHVLRGREDLQIPIDRLASYDLRIREYVERLNLNRSLPICLRYFQYLAVLFAEAYLHYLFEDRKRLLKDLNNFVSENQTESIESPIYNDNDLKKLAFWMATGSGKTLIMHINIWQYAYYSRNGRFHDNILLITPNEGLSRQHLEELRKSGIPACQHGEAGNNQMQMYSKQDNRVRVIEITKLTETKRGRGLTVEVDTFGSNNLLFVDEGHRGASGDVWRHLRERVASNGFTFEYSATFGQIVNGASITRRPKLLEEYSKAILFDYSYPHFYHDGFGKDYWITNLKDSSNDFSSWMILGNLLSFYEQHLVFESNRDGFHRYNIERPLWVFVGHSVTRGKSKDDKASLTDVEQVVDFLDDFLSHKSKWVQNIANILDGNTGLMNQFKEDVFQRLFTYMKRNKLAPEDIYKGIIEHLFHGQVGDRIRAIELKSAKGEIGLRVGAGTPYFGVINIGHVRGLIKLLEARNILCAEDRITQSLFDNINHADSQVNLLVGSRKFTEGWDSYRVSSMGLMNIGKGEGSQIIQLFGRGVRLKGKNLSLKRSTSLKQIDAPADISFLEMLSIFGVRANYMEQFRNHLNQEGIDTDFDEFEIPIHVQDKFLSSKLQLLKPDSRMDYRKDACVILKLEKTIHIRVDLRPKVEVTTSQTDKGLREQKLTLNMSDKLRRLALLLNWDWIYLEMLKSKQIRGLTNIVFTLDTLRAIVEKGDYEIICPEEYLSISRFGELKRVEEIALGLLKKYLIVYYNRDRRKWEQSHLSLKVLDKDDPNIAFGAYHFRAPSALTKSLRDMIEKSDDIYHKDVTDFPNIHFDRHLYQPLLISDPTVSCTPPGLNKGETKFIKDLRNYLQKNTSKLEGKEVFLLRNLTRGKGIGLFEIGEGAAFYPDFILWIVDQKNQMISFIDPHGMIYAQHGFNDPKIRIHRHLKILEQQLNEQVPAKRIQLTSIIISVTPHSELCKVFGDKEYSRERFEAENVIFQEDSTYIEKCIAITLGGVPEISE